MLRVKEHRQAQGLSREALAYLSGLTLKTIGRIERGEGTTSKSLAAIATALKVEVADLYSPPKKNGRKRRSA